MLNFFNQDICLPIFYSFVKKIGDPYPTPSSYTQVGSNICLAFCGFLALSFLRKKFKLFFELSHRWRLRHNQNKIGKQEAPPSGLSFKHYFERDEKT
jgi:hypothetical protein